MKGVLFMILNSTNLILTQKGATKKELLKNDQALVYQSPSKINSMGYAGDATRIIESTTIPSTYFNELSKMKGFISLGTTGTGENKEHKNIRIYSEQAEYLDGINRICYLFPDATKTMLKVCEYKKGSRGSRYSSLYRILKDKLEECSFPYENECFTIDLNNITPFVDVINEINLEQTQEKYVLLKDKEIDELSFGVFDVVYWEYDTSEYRSDTAKEIIPFPSVSNDIISKIDSCSDVEILLKLEQEISAILLFCKSKIAVLKLLQNN